MSNSIFREGGSHYIRRTGRDRYTMSVAVPTDAMGMTARECPDRACSPGRFKVKSGTGVTGDQLEAYCPYCRRAEDPDRFITKEQERHLRDIVTEQAAHGIQRMMKGALRLGPNGKKKIGRGLVSMTIGVKVSRPPPVRLLREAQLRRDVTCPHCTLEHAVYGLAVWCPDCGEDIFLTHVETESQVVFKMLAQVGRRRDELGPRVSAHDIEDGLENVVSILEASMKAMTRRRLVADGRTDQDAESIMKKQVRTRFQGYTGTVEVLDELFGLDLSAALVPGVVDRFRQTIEKRHPITHNLGIADRKHLEKTQSSEAEGRDVILDGREVIDAMGAALALVRQAHAGLFPS